MQSVSSRIWTRIAVFISYGDNNYTTGTSIKRWYYSTQSLEDKEFHTFPKGICPKVNVIARLEFELAICDSEVQRLNHYTTGFIACQHISYIAYLMPNPHYTYILKIWFAYKFCW